MPYARRGTRTPTPLGRGFSHLLTAVTCYLDINENCRPVRQIYEIFRLQPAGLYHHAAGPQAIVAKHVPAGSKGRIDHVPAANWPALCAELNV